MTEELLSSTIGGDAQVIADLADKAAGRTVVEIPGTPVVALVVNGNVVREWDTEKHALTPNRKTGHVSVTTADSLVEYVERHKILSSTTLWGDSDAGRIVAVIDDHPDTDLIDDANWGQHRATLTLKTTPDWKHWLALDGKLVEQLVFAEHIEFGAANIVRPSSMQMLEVAENFHAKKGVDFKSGARNSSGETQLRWEEHIDAKVGKTGSIEVPTTFVIAVAPFYGNTPVEIEARFRYRITPSGLVLGYQLVRPDLVREAAFDEQVGIVTRGLELPVIAGTPRS